MPLDLVKWKKNKMTLNTCCYHGLMYFKMSNLNGICGFSIRILNNLLFSKQEQINI